MKSILKFPVRYARKQLREKFLRDLDRTLDSLPGNDGIRLFDVGAAGDIEPRWKSIERHLHYVGFEPDERSRQLLQSVRSACRSYEILPYAIWDSDTEVDFNFCKKPQVSSAFQPNRSIIDRYPESGRFDVVSRSTIKVISLDSLGLPPADFVKVDIQGGELHTLMGAPGLLNDAFGLELEVEFLPLYRNQPLFGDVTKWLANQGYEFVDFVNLVRWERTSLDGHGQCVFGDALYLKMPEAVDLAQLPIDRIAAYFGILTIYRRFDLVEATFRRIGPAQRDAFVRFMANIDRLRRSDAIARGINRFCWSLVSAINPNCRTHLIY